MALHRKKGTTSNVHFKEFMLSFLRGSDSRVQFQWNRFSRRKLLNLE